MSAPATPPGLNHPQLQKAMQTLRENKPQAAEVMLRRFLETEPDNVFAMVLLAETLVRFDRYKEADEQLSRAIALAPDFVGARHNYVTVLLVLGRRDEAFAQIDEMFRLEPENPNHHALRAMACAWVGDHAGAIAEYEIVLRYLPKSPAPWMAHGHTLRTVGRGAEAADAYRKAIERFPRLGEPYWSLANLKTFRFTDAEIAQMRTLLETADLPVESRVQINFALGRALEDRADYEGSWTAYNEGNSLKRATISYNAEMTSVYVMNCRTLFTEKFFAEHDNGTQARDPIFVVGMPRSGSTLVEQILASHSQIEGTMELRILPYLVGRIGAKGIVQYRAGQTHPALATDMQAPYPEVLRNLDPESAAILGEEYIERSRQHRTTDRPFFVDKMPDNFAHIGLIRMILPNAKIVDVRRHPLACGFSNYKHYFAMGKDFSYRLDDLGRYYCDYVDLMAHFDKVLPGRIHRVLYEKLVGDLEGETRKLFDYLGVPFEDKALKFHETERAVRTPSSEQVRMPLYSEGLDQWKHYEQWLEPLKAALGPKLDGYADDLAKAR
ncbi:MAG TPA: sulfotransferase [Rhizomicrobium sp.]|nr:sulfotransferase [Rhizomicrobium sp.]